MNTKPLTILVLCLISLVSCIQRDGNPDFSIKKLKDFETDFNFKYISYVPNQIAIINSDSGFHLYFQDMMDRKTIMFTLRNDTVLTKSDTGIKVKEYFFETFFKTDDSIFQLKANTKSIVLRNRQGDKLKEYTINQSFNPVPYPPGNLRFSNNSYIIGNASSTISFGLKKDRLEYYSVVKPLLYIKIKDTTLQYMSISEFPEKYIKTGDNYNEPFPAACFGKDNDICVSFGADDYLSLYKDSTLLYRKPAKSKYIDKFISYPDDKQFDMLFLKNYSAEEPKYSNILFDPFDNVYYRIAIHRFVKMADGKTRQEWSVIVLDTRLKVLGELKMTSDYNKLIFIPTPLGIITAKQNPKNPEKTILSLIKISRNAN